MLHVDQESGGLRMNCLTEQDIDDDLDEVDWEINYEQSMEGFGENVVRNFEKKYPLMVNYKHEGGEVLPVTVEAVTPKGH